MQIALKCIYDFKPRFKAKIHFIDAHIQIVIWDVVLFYTMDLHLAHKWLL